MIIRKLTSLTACFVVLTAAVLVKPDPAAAQSPRFCDGYARDYAQRNSRGQVIGGAAMGAIGGALLGGIIGGGRGAGTGALIGGGTGALVGGAQQSNDYNSLYWRAYNQCMRQ